MKREMKLFMEEQKRIRAIQITFGISEIDAKKALDEVGSDIDKIGAYLKKIRYIPPTATHICKRCGRPLKSVQSIIDGYGSSCKKKMDALVRYGKNHLVEDIDYETIKQSTAPNSGEQS